MLSIGTRVRKFDQVLAIAERHDNVFCTVGTHPHNAAEEPDVTADDLVELAQHPKVVGIGEAGLDYHYDLSPRDVQAAELPHPYRSGARDRPAARHPQPRGGSRHRRHSRRRDGEGRLQAACSIASRPRPNWRGGAWSSAPMSPSPASSPTRMPRTSARRRAEVPLDRLLVETDAPYLAPVPYRGKTNEPAFVVKTLEKLADVKGVTREDMARDDEPQFLRPVRQGAEARTGPRRMAGTLTILGCGSSGGVPRIGNHWGLCDPANPKNRRRRCSVLLSLQGEAGETRVLDRYVARSARSDADDRHERARCRALHP